jgi:LGFP repeat
MGPNPTEPKDEQPFGSNFKVLDSLPLQNVHIVQWQNAEKAAKTINAYWSSLNGAPGDATSGVETVLGGYRIRFTNGAIYLSTQTSVCAWIYGAINEYYQGQGGAESWLGLPTTDEQPFTEGGRFVFFANGTIFWWPDTGAIALNNVVVRYVGLICFGETDWDQGSDSDEPYAFISVVAGQGGGTVRTKIYGEPKSVGGDGGESVDGGEARSDYQQIYLGRPSGVGIYVSMMEHDFGKPEDYLPDVEEALNDYFLEGLDYIPVFGPVLSSVIKFAGAAVAEAISDVLDLKDDKIGSGNLQLTPKMTVVQAARPRYRNERGLKFTHETPLLVGGGASYKLYFEVVALPVG